MMRKEGSPIVYEMEVLRVSCTKLSSIVKWEEGRECRFLGIKMRIAQLNHSIRPFKCE